MIKQFVQEALAEDVGRGDLYALVEPAVASSSKIIAKSNGVLAGKKYVDVLCQQEKIAVSWLKHDTDSLLQGM